MSKIGRKPIELSTAKVTIEGNKVTIQGAKEKVEHVVPGDIKVAVDGKQLLLSVEKRTRENSAKWGLHRALLANIVKGVEKGFEQKVTIVGLGFKAIANGKKLTFSLGYSHKIDYELPVGVSVDIDKSGQNLLFKASDRFLLGNVCDQIRAFRRPEPYKGTGILREQDVVIRKAGKTKSA